MPRWTKVNFDPGAGYPAAADLYYECTLCASRDCSVPGDSAACGCGNVRIDVDSGRISVKDDRKIHLARQS